MILVTGATGTVGSSLIPLLADRGAPVRVLVRSPEKVTQLAQRHGVRVAVGDLDRPASLVDAVDGCDHVFLLSPPDPRQVERETQAIDVAAQHGVEHIVALSVVDADQDSPVAFARWHAAIDGHLRRSGVGYTILRPAAFMQVHLLALHVDTLRSEGCMYGISGGGRLSFVDAQDVAAVAAQVLATRGHQGQTYVVTGPQALSLPEAADHWSQVLGREVRYIDLAPDQYRAALVGAGLPDWLADSAVALYGQAREGRYGSVTDTVEKMTGRSPRSFTEFARDHRAAVEGG